MSDQCEYVHRIGIRPSIKMGAVSIGQCKRQALPGMTVCAWHATPEAVTYAMNHLIDEYNSLRLAHDNLKKSL